MKKPNTVEVTLRVRVPKGMSAAKVKYEIAQAWYGEIYANTGQGVFGEEVSLFPRWSKARTIKRGK